MKETRENKNSEKRRTARKIGVASNFVKILMVKQILFPLSFQSLIMNDQCPVQYVTYNQTTQSYPGSDEDDGSGYYQ